MLTQGSIASGVFKGAGAAKTIECGFIPDLVILTNSRGSAETVTLSHAYQVLGFDSGSSEFLPDDNIKETTNAGTATVVGVHVATGSWADGDAAGFLVLRGVTGTIANNEPLSIVGDSARNRATVADAATADGAPVRSDVDIDTEAGIPAAEFVVPYAGTSGGNTKGFTIAAGAAVSTEWIWWVAVRGDNMILG